MVDCLRDQQDPTGSSPGFQARLQPHRETSRLADGISWSRRQSTMDSLIPSNHMLCHRRSYPQHSTPTPPRPVIPMGNSYNYLRRFPGGGGGGHLIVLLFVNNNCFRKKLTIVTVIIYVYTCLCNSDLGYIFLVITYIETLHYLN